MVYLFNDSYIGPDPLDEQNRDSDVYLVMDGPFQSVTNGELAVHGASAAFNDRFMYCYGTFDSIKSALAFAESTAEDNAIRICDETDMSYKDILFPYDTSVLAVAKPGKYYEWSGEDTKRLLSESTLLDEIPAGISDDEIEKKAAEIAKCHKEHFAILLDIDVIIELIKFKISDI